MFEKLKINECLNTMSKFCELLIPKNSIVSLYLFSLSLKLFTIKCWEMYLNEIF